MKKLILIAIIGASSILVARADETNMVKAITNDTNITQAIVSILGGAKDVGGDIYDTSKLAISKSVDFVKQQAPDLIESFVKWKFVEAAVYTVAGAIGLILAIYLGIYFSKKAYSSGEEFLIMPAIFSFAATIPSMIGFSNIMTCLYIYTAPKVYLIEYIMNHIHR